MFVGFFWLYVLESYLHMGVGCCFFSHEQLQGVDRDSAMVAKVPARKGLYAGLCEYEYREYNANVWESARAIAHASVR